MLESKKGAYIIRILGPGVSRQALFHAIFPISGSPEADLQPHDGPTPTKPVNGIG